MRYQLIHGALSGFRDMSDYWKAELEIDNLEEVVDHLYAEVEPLYKQLYAFVRGRLAASDKSGAIQPDRPLPAHILGQFNQHSSSISFE